MPDIKIKRYADKENLKELMKYSKDTFANKSEINEKFYTYETKADAADTYLSKTDAASTCVQTGAVDQTVAGTKTFSKPIVGSVTGSSGSCTGNAATATTAGAVSTSVADGSSKDLVYAFMADSDAFRIRCGGGGDNGYVEIATSDNGNEPIYVRQYYKSDGELGSFTSVTRTLTLLDENGNTQLPGTVTAPTFSGNLNGNVTGNAATATNATYANWLRTSSHSDHLFHTEWDGSYFWTYVTAGDGGYRAVRVARSDSAATAQACTGNAASADIATKATQDSDGNKITTTYSKNGHTHDDRYYTEAEVNNLLAGKANSSHTHPYIPTSASCNKNWHWQGQGGQPSWLWGGEDGTNMYVYNPSNFSVNYANSAGSCTGNAATATNATNSNAANQLQAFVNDNFTGGNHYVKAIRSSYGWSTHLWMCYNNGAKMADEVSVNYANSAGNGVPAGVIIPFAGTSVPTGYLLCNGAAVSRTDYANLFAAIGTLYGAGDGSTTFNLPDARDRVLQGASGGHSAGSYIGAGLPNITGSIGNGGGFYCYFGGTRAFFVTPSFIGSAHCTGSGENLHGGFEFNAQRCSALYGASNTVQSPAIATNFIIKY